MSAVRLSRPNDGDAARLDQSEGAVMLQKIARSAIAAPRRIIAAALLIMAAAAIFGVPVTKSLSSGGFQDPASQSRRASQLMADKFGTGDMQLILAVTSDTGAHSSAARAAGDELVTLLKRLPYVTDVKSAWTASPGAAPAMLSKDGKTGLILAGITGGESGAQQHAAQLLDRLPHFNGVTVKAGGEVTAYVQILGQIKKDLLVMEAIAVPLSFVVLVWVFGGLLAAALPLAVGVFAILGSMAVMHAITFVADVSVFALNLVLAMGLALAIDYTLLIVSRFRDEMAGGAARDEAIVRTMATAGRTVLFSATTVALSTVALALFPMYFLKSFAYAGVAVVALAATASVTVTPAAIVLLGDRVDSLDLRRGIRRMLGRPQPAQRAIRQTFWYGWTKAAMRQALPISLVTIAVLLVLGAPFLGVKWGYPDDRVLPTSASAREIDDQVRSDFAVNSLTDVIVVVPDAADVTPRELGLYAAELSRVPDVSAVSSAVGTYVSGALVGPPSAPSGRKAGSAFLSVNSVAPLYSRASETQLDRLHAVAAPHGAVVQMTGWAQINRDSSHAVTSRLPLVLSVMAVITFALLFLLTGSVVLPLKALVLNMLSLTAAFGALVWIFQQGHFGALGTTATGTLEASVPVLLFCIAFGLSMDYEVFLISRIREFWLASPKTHADNTECVALGIARTGRVVTAAALLMAVTFASLMTAKVSLMCMFGVGVPLAVLIDATLVRMLLVPAFMRILGPLNWWAPAPLTRLHRRFGISESGELPELLRPRQATTRNGSRTRSAATASL
jgi:putative drug exporter of the RND superfamily